MSTENNEKKTTVVASTKLTKMSNALAPMIEKQLTANGIHMTDYQKQCVLMGIASINAMLDKEGLSWASPNFDGRNLTELLQTIACLQLNASATPREIYFQTRNVQVKDADGNKGGWKKQIEMGIEGDGNDSILARFGRGVKKVGQFWQVRENDPFTYPKHTGFDMTPPEWTETGVGKVVRIVYPLLMADDSVQFHIAEREDVKKNLAAHMSNNLMNETFGICKKRYDASPDQLKQIAARKKTLLDKLAVESLDAALDDPELQPYISPAWTEPHSRESMIIRKMRNNIVKKIPKDFSNAYIATTYMNASDDTKMLVDAEIAEDANKEAIDVEYGEVPETDPATSEVMEHGEDKPETENPVTEPQTQTEAPTDATEAAGNADGQISMGDEPQEDAAKAKRGTAKKDPF